MTVADVVSILMAIAALVSAIAGLVRSMRLRRDVNAVKGEHAEMREDLSAFEDALEKTGSFQRPTRRK